MALSFQRVGTECFIFANVWANWEILKVRSEDRDDNSSLQQIFLPERVAGIGEAGRELHAWQPANFVQLPI